jgi:hypothetical protein
MASTYSPIRLTEARRFLLQHIGPFGLASAEVGIVGDTPHVNGGSSYHLGKGQLRSDSYTITESVRDRNGLSNAASGMDIGEFTATVNGKRHTLRSFSIWLVAQCKAGTADTADIREVIYSPDGVVVKRWDRLNRRTTGDSSHLWHTHISYFRDSESRDKTALFRRYLTEIGLLEDDDMPTAEEIAKAVWAYGITDFADKASPQRKLAAGTWLGYSDARHRLTESRIGAAIAGLDAVDETAVAAAVLAVLTPQAIAAALPDEVAEQVAQELAERLAS